MPVAEEQVREHPVFQLGRRMLEGDLSAKRALQTVRSPGVLAALDDESIDRLDDYVRTLVDDERWTQVCYVLAELNCAAAQVRVARPEIRASCANTLGNALGDLRDRMSVDPELHIAILNRRIELYRDALHVWQDLRDERRVASLSNNLSNALRTRFEALGQIEDLEAAIVACQKALEMASMGSVEWATYQGNLSGVLIGRFEALGQVKDLDAAIAACKQALSVTHKGAPGWAAYQANLGVGLSMRTRASGQMKDLDAAIAAYEQGIAVTPKGSSDWATCQANLGSTLRTRFKAMGQVEDLEAAIAAYEQALAVTQDGTPDWAFGQASLGGALLERFEALGRPTDLEAAITAHEQALEVTREGSPSWAAYRTSLGVALGTRYWALGQMEDLEAAIAAYEQALAVTQEGSPEWAHRQATLAVALRTRFAALGRVEDVDGAIAAFESALAVTRKGSPEWARRQANLALAMSMRFKALGQIGDLKVAVAAYRQALHATRKGSPSWGTYQVNLGVALRMRFEALGQVEDLDAAIAAHRAALEVAREGSLRRATYQARFAVALRIRFEALGQVEDLDAAIAALESALRVTQEGSPRWALCQADLGLTLRARFDALRQVEDLEAAIAAYEQALAVTQEGTPDWGSRQVNRGVALTMLFQALWQVEHLDAAIAAFESALAVVWEGSPDWAMCYSNLGIALRTRFKALGQAEDLDAAISAYQQALSAARQDSPDWARLQANLGNTLSTLGDTDAAIAAYQGALNVFVPEVYPDYTLGAAVPAGRLLVQRGRRGDLAEAIKVYRVARRAADYLYFESLHQGRREREMRRTQGLATNYAYALAHEGNPREAVEALEAGRARTLAESLLGQQALETLSDSAHEEALERAWRNTREAQSLYNHAEEEDRRLQAEAQLAQARGAYYDCLRDAFPDYFEPPTFDSVKEAAAEAPLAYLTSTEAGGLALVVSPETFDSTSEVSVIWLDDLTEELLRRRLMGPADDAETGGYFGAYGAWRRNSVDQSNRKAWFRALDATTSWVWDVAVGPVLECVTDLGFSRATLIPTGLLGMLPLHAAWTGGPHNRRYALEAVRLTYVPNARALTAARRTAKSVFSPHDLVAIDNPDGSLHFSDEEVTAVLETFSRSCRSHLAGDHATLECVQRNLTRHSVWHFSTHGWGGWLEPLDSGLLLAHAEQLTLRDLLALQASARLAVLSACETGVPGTQLPDEAIGLPAGLLQAGVAGVVSSLWAVNDFSTALLMMRFYQCWREEEQEPPEALRSAQLWLRDAASADLVDYFQRHLPEFAGERLPRDVADLGYRRFALEDPDERPFAHPFYWAGFYYTGV